MAKEKSARLSILGTSLGIGVTLGLYTLAIGWSSMYGWGGEMVNSLSSFYMGYESSFIGGIIGGIWGFFHGLIAGALISFFYNRFRK